MQLEFLKNQTERNKYIKEVIGPMQVENGSKGTDTVDVSDH